MPLPSAQPCRTWRSRSLSTITSLSTRKRISSTSPWSGSSEITYLPPATSNTAVTISEHVASLAR